jgi:hypothetical protein
VWWGSGCVVLAKPVLIIAGVSCVPAGGGSVRPGAGPLK